MHLIHVKMYGYLLRPARLQEPEAPARRRARVNRGVTEAAPDDLWVLASAT
jgi:hypothetical protein